MVFILNSSKINKELITIGMGLKRMCVCVSVVLLDEHVQRKPTYLFSADGGNLTGNTSFSDQGYTYLLSVASYDIFVE